MAIDKNDNLTPEVLESQPSPYDVVQNNRTLPRDIFTSGTLTGNTVMRIGDQNVTINGKESNFQVEDGTIVRVIVGKYQFITGGGLVDTYGIKIVDNNGNTILDTGANILAVGTVSIGGDTGIMTLTNSDGTKSLAFTPTLAGTNIVSVNGATLSISAHITSTGSSVLFDKTIYTTGDVVAVGDIYGAHKYFLIPHPNKEDKNLQYSTLETPEVLLMCRGNGEVILPDHFIAMTESDTLQTIKDKENGNWLVTGIRKGFKDFNCEPNTIKQSILLESQE